MAFSKAPLAPSIPLTNQLHNVIGGAVSFLPSTGRQGLATYLVGFKEGSKPLAWCCLSNVVLLLCLVFFSFRCRGGIYLFSSPLIGPDWLGRLRLIYPSKTIEIRFVLLLRNELSHSDQDQTRSGLDRIRHDQGFPNSSRKMAC